ncbi:hypothetical protein VNO80_10636 [Phaseolus coccineus]|uniref:Uncharacterized protein n=1 Tax=Phaseolus coccineus TaxID=3886 RepID=A0AAN9NDR6_PHACN
MFAAQGCGFEMRADSLMSWHEVKFPFAHFLMNWCGVQDFGIPVTTMQQKAQKAHAESLKPDRMKNFQAKYISDRRNRHTPPVASCRVTEDARHFEEEACQSICFDVDSLITCGVALASVSRSLASPFSNSEDAEEIESFYLEWSLSHLIIGGFVVSLEDKGLHVFFLFIIRDDTVCSTQSLCSKRHSDLNLSSFERGFLEHLG